MEIRLALALTLVSLSTVHCQTAVKTTDGKDCVFPFTYKDVVYNQCIDEGNNGVLWCATTNNYPQDRQYGNCQIASVKTTDNKDCVFPFSYKDVVYYQCTDEANNGILWCSTTNNYPQDRQFGICQVDPTTTKAPSTACDTFSKMENTVSTAGQALQSSLNTLKLCWDGCMGNAQCVGYEYDRSTNQCHFHTNAADFTTTATNTNMDQYRKTKVDCSTVETEAGVKCVFPFLFNAKSETACIASSIEGKYWCATTDNLDTNPSSWAYCKAAPTTDCNTFMKMDNTMSSTGQTLQSSLNTLKLCWDGCMVGDPCVGFEYDRSANQCHFHTNAADFTTTATNTNMDQYRKTEVDCSTVETEKGDKCVFPFIYESKSVTACVASNIPDRYWCATTDNLDVNTGAWAYCKAGPTTDIVTVDGKKCAIPFVYQGVTYTECTTFGDTELWCALTNPYQQGQFGYCKIDATTTVAPTDIVTVDGKKCAIPFVYQDVTYTECTTFGDTKLWCALTNPYQQGQFGYCKTDATTAATTTAAPPTSCRTYTERENVMSATGQAIQSTRNTLKLCWDGCSATANCAGFDYDRSLNRCYYHLNAADFTSTSANTNMDQYRALTVECTKLQTEGGVDCVFPFINNGKYETSCVASSIPDRYWCATVENLDSSPTSWAYCKYAPPREVIFTVDGKECAIPFVYKEVTYDACTTVGDTKPWCSLTNPYTGQFGYCADGLATTTAAPTPAPNQCSSYKIMTNTASPNVQRSFISTSTTSKACRDSCEADTVCMGFDFGGPTNCFIHQNKANMVAGETSTSGYSQHRRFKANCPVCNPYEAMQNMDAPGGLVVDTNIMLSLCRDVCSRRVDCFGFDFNPIQTGTMTDATTGSCTIHVNSDVANTLFTTNGNIFYRRTFCKTCVDDFEMVPNTETRYPQNVIQTGVTNELDCASRCFFEPSCTGFDTHTNSANQYVCDLTSDLNIRSNSVSGDSRFTLFVRLNCAATACPATFTTTSRTRYDGGSRQSYTSQSDCQTNCAGQDTCLGFDFNGVAFTCDFHFNSANFATTVIDSNVNHHRRVPCGASNVMTDKGKYCMFPFIYNSKTYTACTTDGASQPWCAHTTVYDANDWGFCITSPTTSTTSATSTVLTESGKPCALPFTYQGQTFSACTNHQDDSGKTWCSLDSTYAGKWEYCATGTPTATTTPTITPTDVVLTVNGHICVIPFDYKGQSYDSCTSAGADKPWCYYDGNKWEYCATETTPTTTPSSTPSSTPTDVVLTVNGHTCVFPFNYKEQSYDSCTSAGADKPWCYHDGDKWDYCATAPVTPIYTTNNKVCVFPFIYNGVSYDACITLNSNLPWCAATSNYDTNKAEWGECMLDNTDCVSGFRIYTSRWSPNQIFQQGVTTQSTCNSRCLADATCMGYEWRNNLCYFHTNANDFSTTFTDSAATQYRKENCSPGTTPCINGVRYGIFLGTGSNGGQPHNHQDLNTCRDSCSTDIACFGYDFIGTNPVNQRCWFHVSVSNFDATYSNVNVNQYRKQAC